MLCNVDCDLINKDILLKLAQIKIYNITQFTCTSVDDISLKTKIPIKVVYA